MNSRIYHDLAERHGITGYPWVTSFYMGDKVEDMAGLGGAESVINWGKAKRSAVWKKIVVRISHMIMVLKKH